MAAHSSRNPAVIEAFARVLRDARAAAGITQEELAWQADVDRTFVGLLETGKRQPSLSVVFSLADALGTTPEKLVKETRSALAA